MSIANSTAAARIGIIGDVHAEHEHLETALAFLQQQGVDTILCTGDVSDGTGCLDTCVDLLQSHEVVTVRGNHDRWVLQDKARHVPNAHIRSEISEPTLQYLEALPAQQTVATHAGAALLCHGVGDNDLQKVWPGTARMPAERSAALDRLLEGEPTTADAPVLMINGHVHYRTIIHFENMVLINAGTLRRDHHPGFSLLDLQRNEITGFEFLPQPTPVKTQSLAAGIDRRVFKNTRQFDGDWEPLTLYA